MSRVFVVQEPIVKRHGRPARRFSLAPAEEFGELVFLLDWSETRGLGANGGTTEAVILWKIRERMEGFDADQDYILMTGNWTAMAMAVALALEMSGGYVRCLQWDRDDGYRTVTIDMNVPPPNGDPHSN